MPKGPGLTVDQLMEEADAPMRALANQLRHVIHKALPKSQELVKWRNPTYLFNGHNVAWIMVHKDHVNLGFFQGAKMKSPRLEGTGKGFRHIKVRGPGDIDEKEFTRLLGPDKIGRSVTSSHKWYRGLSATAVIGHVPRRL